MIRIREIDHLVLRVVDLDGMLHFYCDVLGCTIERRQDSIGLVQLRAGRSLVDLVPIGCVKFPLTDGQDLRLLCIGGRCNLFTVQSIQSTENAYEINQSHRAICAGASGRYGYGCFGTRFSVVGRSLIGQIAESRTFRQVSDSAYFTLLPGAAAAAATRRIKRRIDGSSARPVNSLAFDNSCLICAWSAG